MEEQMHVFAAAMAALRAGPAPKTLVVLSNGAVPLLAHDLSTRLEAMKRAAADAGLQFYALTEYDDGVNFGDTGRKQGFQRSQARKDEGNTLYGGIQAIANAAGGEAFKVIGQPARFFDRILSETSGIYRLGVETPAARSRTPYLEAKVSVRRPGLTVRAHPRVIAKSPAT